MAQQNVLVLFIVIIINKIFSLFIIMDYDWVIVQLEYLAENTDERSKYILDKVIRYIKECRDSEGLNDNT